MNFKNALMILAKTLLHHARNLAVKKVFFGRALSNVPRGAIVFFPVRPGVLCCGLAGIVAKVPDAGKAAKAYDLDTLEKGIERIGTCKLEDCIKSKNLSLARDYM